MSTRDVPVAAPRRRNAQGPDAAGTVLDRLGAVPAGEWQRCPACRCALHRTTWARLHGVCPACEATRRLSAGERIGQLADPGTFVEHLARLRSTDPLRFTDSKPYSARLRAAHAGTEASEAAVIGTAHLRGRPVVLLVMDFGFLGGSMGVVVGEKVAAAADLAVERGTPLVAVSCSGGARMQEGMYSLLQVARAADAVRRLNDAGVPFVSVLTDPVYGGVAASFASLGDVVLAEVAARSGFAGPRVIAQALGERLPADFQTAEFLRAHGHLDLVVARAELPDTLDRVLGCLANRPVPGAPALPDAADPPGIPLEAGADGHGSAWDAVRVARDPARPNVLDHVAGIFDDFVELHGDRHTEDDPAVVGGLARWGGTGFVVLGHAKEHDPARAGARNFGMPHPSGFRKATRLMRLAGRLGLPVVTFVDTPGAYAGRRAEEGNQSGAIAEALLTASGLPVPLVTVVIGEGGSGGALALAAGDAVLAMRNTYFSVISPEGCAAILYGDAGRAPEAAAALRLRATDLYAAGLVDELVPEPAGGAQAAPPAAVAMVKAALRRCLTELGDLAPESLLARRDHRLRTRGASRDAIRAEE
jgi:acetyl-CoA carboxylase carboxyl transferase alpha subunit/acetyl-CoA carboxylase carboxyl transferase beta subunit